MILRLVLIGFVLTSPLLYAQNAAVSHLPSDSWALQFGIGNNFTLSGFQGGMIGIKRQVTETSAWRLCSGINASIGTEKITEQNGILDSTDIVGEGDTESSEVSFSLQYISYLAQSGDVHLYLGGGPSVAFGHTLRSPDPVEKAYSNGRYFRIEEHSFSAGGAGILGVEWLFHKSMSLHAEYHVFAGYTTSRSRYENTGSLPANATISEREEKKAVFQSNGVLFGLSVYL